MYTETDNSILLKKKSILGSFYDGVRIFRIIEGPRKFLELLWWEYMPGVKVKLHWPNGDIIVDHNDPRWVDMGGAVWVNLGFSADPNEHYRPWIEQHIGRQGWHWNWRMEDNDVAKNQLTLKVCKSRSKYATMAAIKWSN